MHKGYKHGPCYIFESKIALNQLDPSGSMVEVVCEPIRKYVRNRPDSAEVIVRQVIAGSEEEVEMDNKRQSQN